MKKLILFSTVVLSGVIPAFSQDKIPEQSEEVPVEQLVLKKNQIPEAISKAVAKDFSEGKPVEFSNFPYLFKQYGWVVQDSANTSDPKPEYYSVFIKSAEGSRMYAVYNNNGKLLRSREVLKDAVLPSEIDKTIARSDYKDWRIVGDRERVIDYENNQFKHYIVRLQKNKKIKTVYFDENGNILVNKKVN